MMRWCRRHVTLDPADPAAVELAADLPDDVLIYTKSILHLGWRVAARRGVQLFGN